MTEGVMFLGLSTFTWFHTLLSLVALASGIIVMIELLGSRISWPWTLLYLVTAVATSVTGFGFPFTTFLPSHWVGVISLVVLAVAIVALWPFRLAGAWRWIYAVGVMLGLYFLVFVTIAQAFKKIPALEALAPTQSEPPFAIAEAVGLVIFAVLTVAAAIKFHPPSAAPA
jgi:hypothetical protein